MWRKDPSCISNTCAQLADFDFDQNLQRAKTYYHYQCILVLLTYYYQNHGTICIMYQMQSSKLEVFVAVSYYFRNNLADRIIQIWRDRLVWASTTLANQTGQNARGSHAMEWFYNLNLTWDMEELGTRYRRSFSWMIRCLRKYIGNIIWEKQKETETIELSDVPKHSVTNRIWARPNSFFQDKFHETCRNGLRLTKMACNVKIAMLKQKRIWWLKMSRYWEI